jgi:DNA polymerase III epsilon subunit family exonuclease
MSDGYVFIDTETSGRDFSARVIEIALVQTSLSGERQKEFTSLIRGDGNSGGPKLVRIHHITDEMIRDAPNFAEVWPEILPMLKNRVLVAHNSTFDQGMINRELERIRESLLGDFLCTLKLARFLGIAFKKTETREGASGKLGDLVKLFGLDVIPDHRALADTHALVSVFWKMKERYPDEVAKFIARHHNIGMGQLKPLDPSTSNKSRRVMVNDSEKSDEDEIHVWNMMDNPNQIIEGQNFNNLVSNLYLPNENLNGAKFFQFKGEGSIFSGSSLDKCDFSLAFLRGAIFQNASAVEAVFSRAYLEYANFIGANLTSTLFQFAYLGFANFTGANLENADTEWVDITETNFTGANLTSANFRFSTAEETNFFSANLTNANFVRSSLNNVNFRSANLSSANFNHAYMGSADLSFVYSACASFAHANLERANLTEANLTEADLAYANLTEANLTGADLTGANLTGANLTKAVMPSGTIHD